LFSSAASVLPAFRFGLPVACGFALVLTVFFVFDFTAVFAAIPLSSLVA